MNQKLFMMVKVGASVSESLDTAACVPMLLTGLPVHVKIASYRGSGLEIQGHFYKLAETILHRMSSSFEIV